jgi:parallel beta-helix repeat protein
LGSKEYFFILNELLINQIEFKLNLNILVLINFFIMRKKIIFLFMLLFTGVTFLNAQVQIGIGTEVPANTLYAPIYCYSSTSTTLTINSDILYTQSELAAVGITTGAIISKLAFYKTNNAATTANGSFKIYMKNSSLTPPLSTSTTWASITAGHTLVYDNSAQTVPSTIGWIEFPINPFTYTGGNLEIAFLWYVGSGTKPTDAFKWQYSTPTADYIIGGTSTSTTPAATLNGSVAGYKHRPNIQIWYTMPNQPMVYDSATTIQPITSPIMGVQTQQVIAALKVNVTGNQSPFSLTSVTFNTNGTTNTSNIAKAQLFYTNSPTFSNAVQLGSDILNPSGSFTFTPTTNNTLASGSNYFWLTYDVAPGTADGNVLDAECTTFTLTGAGTKIPTVTNPGPGRIVRYPLTGVKTINSALPTSGNNFQTFADALAALNSVGVGTGGVTFNIASGTYTEQVNLTQFPGVSVSNPVLFQSLTGNPNDVILQATPTSSANYVLQFDGADYTTVKNITIQLTGTIGSYACVVNGIGMSEYITLLGNRIIGFTGTTTGTAYSAIYFQSGTANMCNNLTIQNNYIQYGSYGLYIYGGSTTALETGNKIINNTIVDWNNYGVYLYAQDGIKVEKNTVTGRGVNATEYGVYLAYCDNITTVLSNKIHARGTSTTYALYPYYCDGIAGQEILIANNFVTITQSTGTAYGLYSNYGNYQKIYHNSVNIAAGSATGGVAFYATSATSGTYGNVDVRNNIFANTNGGYAVYITSGAVTLGYITTMDYNDIFSTGTNIGYYNTAAVVNNLNTWKSTTGKDANSISVNPAFISSTDLHISEMALNGSCMQLPEVPDDIDSQLRNNPTDMGADEFTPSTMVLDSITVTHPVLASVATGSANNVILRIAVHTSNSLNPLSLEGITFNTNGSSNPLNDIENAKLWSSGNVNNFANATQIGNTYNNPNNLFQINTGTGLPVTLNTGINYFWLTYNINSSATNLNVVDAEVVDVNINGNNYQPVNGAPNGTRTIRTPLSGIYQIGTGGDYSTLSAFFADVNQLGLMGNVTAKIISDITETATVSINSWNEYPANSNYTLIIQPQGARVITGNIASALIKLNGNKNLIIDGLNSGGNSLTIENTSTSTNTAAIWVSSLGAGLGATNNIIKNCIIKAGSNTVTSTFGIYVGGTSISTSGTGADNNNLTIQNNTIQRTYYGIYASGVASTGLLTGLTISGNVVGSENANDYVIFRGVALSNTTAPLVEKNTIFNLKTSSSINIAGIDLGANVTDAVISKNKIYGIYSTSSSGYGAFGINISSTSTSNINIVNNMIYDLITVNYSTSSTIYNAFGIRVTGGTNHKIYFNSINLYGNVTTGSSAGMSAALVVTVTTATGMDVRNNIFANSTNFSVSGSKSYAAYVVSGVSFANINYNNYFVSGTYGVLGFYGADKATLADWQASSTQDANSKNVNPLFAANNDLHVVNNMQLLNAGVQISGINDDIDGDLRGVNPCIGADEFIIPSNDIKVKALYTLGQLPLQTGAPHFVSALIENNGTNAQSNINVTLNITGANTFTNVKTIASLASGAVDTVIFNGFTPTALGLNNVKVSVPNDEVNTNNQLNYRQEVTNNTFNYSDTAIVATSIGFGTNAGYFVNKYTINGTKQIYSTKVFITNSATVGKSLYGVIFNNNGVLMDTSFRKTITSSDLNTWVTFDFLHPSSTSTTNNFVYVGIAQVANAAAYYPISCQAETPTRRGAYYYSSGLTGFTPVESLTWGRFMIAAVVGDPATKDASVVQIVNPSSGCALNNQSVTIKIKNEGSQPILASQNSLTASYRIDNGTVVTQNVNLDIPAQGSVNFTFSTQANLPAPTADVNYLITAWTDLINDPLRINDTLSKSVTSGYTPPAPTFVSPVSIPYATSTTLSATSTDSIRWYNALNDTVPLKLGSTYTTPILFNHKTYYLASSKNTFNQYQVGPADSTIGAGGTIGATSYDQVFDVLAPGGITLKSVKIYPATSGSAYVLVIKDAGGNVIRSYNGTTTVGSSLPETVTLNFDIPQGTGYRLGYTSGPSFFRNSAGAVYPYTVPNVISITGNTFSSGQNYWYNAYNWIVTTGTASTCESNRVPLQVNISNIPANDAGVDTLILPTTSVSAGSTVPIKVKIKNYGSANLTSVMIGWSINGALQTPYSWTGNITQGNVSGEVTIANKLLTNSGILSIKAWPYNPNGSVDNYAINDTATGTIIVSLNGSYTIGTGGDFPTINSAVNVLNTVGISGNVVFNILPGIYNEKLIINHVEGVAANKTITFQSQNLDSTSVVISDSSLTSTDNYVIRLNGADYVTLKHLTIQNRGVTYGRAIDMLGGTNFVRIANNIIESSLTGTASTTAGIYSATGIDSNMVIENNVIRNGYYGVYLSGTSSTVKESNNIIRNNRIIDFFYYGIYSYYQNNTIIEGNYLLNRTTASTQYGLSSYYNDNVIISKNQIYLRGTSTCYGMYLYYNNSSTGNSLIANNFVAQSVGTGSVYAIYNSNTKYTKFYNNSISITKGSTTNYGYYQTGTTTGMQLLNNVFSNTGGGYAVYFSSTILDSSNYNCLFTTGANIAYWTSARATLAAYQAASGRDAFSINVYPQFTDSIMDLHINNIALTEKGTSVPEVTDDIDGQARGPLPTIGADEYLASKTLNITVFLEGLFNGVNMNPVQDDMGDHFGSNIADQITVELRNALDPSVTAASFTGQLLSTNGLCSITIPSTLGDAYYIVVKHRNSIQTWSSVPLSFTGSVINYNFTNSASSAYGDNLKEVATGVYAIYVGDVNQDGLVDGSDMSDIELENNNFASGYIVADVNGDGIVDGSDMSIVETNNNNFIGAIEP